MCAGLSWFVSFRENYPNVFPYEIPNWLIYPISVLAIGLPIGSVFFMSLARYYRADKAEQKVEEEDFHERMAKLNQNGNSSVIVRPPCF